MSLLTDALRLRERRAEKKPVRIEDLPPFRTPKPYTAAVAVVAVCVGLGALLYWRGLETYDWLERIVLGLPPKPTVAAATAPAKPAGAGQPEEKVAAEAVAKPEESVKPEAVAGKPVAVAKHVETVKPEGGGKAMVAAKPLSPTPDAVAAKVLPAKPAETPAPRAAPDPPAAASAVPPPSAAVAEKAVVPGVISAEGKQRGEILLTDNLVKAVAEKPAAVVPPARPVEAAPKEAAVPAGGLQPMKVELAAAELAVATTEEREKWRIDAVEEYLRALKVQGVRLQGAESRILVDGMPIGLGEKVGALGLVLESVDPQKIIFSDASGRRYPKSY